MNEEILRSFSILELEPNASVEEITKAYRDLVKVWHPDRFSHDPALQTKAQEKLKNINLAYELLRTHAAQTAEPNSCKNGEFTVVDRFVYYKTCCDETVAISSLPNSDWAKRPPTVEWARIMAEFAGRMRGIEYLLNNVDFFRGNSQILTHTDFVERRIYLNRLAPLTMKSVVLPIGIVFIRDLLNGISNGKLHLVSTALKTAGWNGASGFRDQNYLRAELILSNGASEFLLDRTLNKRSEWSDWWKDMGSYRKVKSSKSPSIEECARTIGYQLMNLHFRICFFGDHSG